MRQVHPMPPQPHSGDAPAPASPPIVHSVESTQCGLCGAKLSTRTLRYHVVSPQCCDAPITVCHTCRNAALGEGYRPAD
jgi:predicted RNA-binding Zn-ribbon protein involved in translation (DUF1610 family)